MVMEMSDREVLRGQLLLQLVEGKIDQKGVAQRLLLSIRQIKRLKRRYIQEGISGLISKQRGRSSNRRIKGEVLAQALSLIGIHYADFGPTLATEKLAEQHGIKLSIETVRKGMIAQGYWKPRRGQMIVGIHPLRARRSRRGELIQIDGSPHDWFEGRAPSCCLLVFIDDATSELMELQFVSAETTLDYMAALRRYIHRHGLPAALYSDRHSIFRINAKEADDEAQTQFSRALVQLGIEGIHANSPQAKGRVERANQTLQDRLVKEMRLQGINDQASANAWLPTFIQDFNKRFAVNAALPDDAHVAYKGKHDHLRRILSVQAERTLSKNLSCQYQGKLLQVKTASQGLGLRNAKVRIHLHGDGQMELLWKGRTLEYGIADKPKKQQEALHSKEVNTRVDRVMQTRRVSPTVNHPWKKVSPESALAKQLLAQATKTTRYQTNEVI